MPADFSNYNAATSYVNGGYQTAQWVSANSTAIAPQVHAALIKKYGNLIGFFDFFNLPQRRLYVKNTGYDIWSKWANERSIKTGANITIGSAGAAISIVMDSSLRDSNGNFPARVGFDVIIPAAYQTCGENRTYRVMSTSQTTYENDTLSCLPWSASGTYVTEAQIGTLVPAGTYLTVGASSWAPGTGQPTSLTDSYTKETFYARILKETWGVEGGQGAVPYFAPIEFDLMGGGKGITNAEILRAEFRLMRQIDRYIRTGETNDNASIVGTSNLGGSNAVISGMGFDVAVDLYGQPLPYTDDPAFSDLSDIVKLARTQGVAADKFDGYLGVELSNKWGDLAREIIKDYSGGSDLMDAAQKRLGCNISVIRWGGADFYLHTLASTGDPASYGVMTGGEYTYNYPNEGFFVPQEMNEVDMKTGKYMFMNGQGSYEEREAGKAFLPNIMMGYVSGGGENRERFGGKLVGPNGFGLGDGYVASEYDAVKGFVNSHVMFIMTNANHIVKMYKA